MSAQKKDSKIRKGVFCLIAAALLLTADQVIKYLVLQWLKPSGPLTLINGLLELSYIENTGVAFGMLQNKLWFIMAVTLAAVIFIMVMLFRYKSHDFLSYTAAAMILAGGVGNIIDRIRFGFVVDFIHVLFFDYIFNFADCCITVGACIFVLHVLLLFRRENREKAEKEAGEAET